MVTVVHRSAVTGMAWTTALGDDLHAVWKRLLNGESGIVELPSAHQLKNLLAAPVRDIDLKLPIQQRLHAMAVHTIQNLIQDAGHKIDATTWLVLGTSFGSRLDDNERASMHQWAQNIASEFGLQDRCISVSTACSSGSDAILVADELIRSNKADKVICGGIDVLTEAKRIAHSELGTMSSTYLRAFDERHDGTLLGEGAGFILLEHAKDKKAYAYLIGCGSANDGAGLTAPDHYGRGASLAIERSLKQAGISASDIGLINAHGSGTPINDEIELHSLQTVFGQKNSPLIFATKGALGHTLGATGALETIALILALREKIVPPIVGLEKLYPFNYPLAVGSAKKHQAHYGLNITLGFGGFDTSLIFEAV